VVGGGLEVVFARRSLAGALGRPEGQRTRSVYDEVMKARIYVDASVVGGCEDDEFSAHSIRLMECFVRGELVLVVSS